MSTYKWTRAKKKQNYSLSRTNLVDFPNQMHVLRLVSHIFQFIEEILEIFEPRQHSILDVHFVPLVVV